MIEYATAPSTTEVVDAGDRHRLRRIPVRRRERHTLDGLTVPSAAFELVRPIVTFAVGCDVSTTVNVAVPPASVVVRPDVGVTVMPAASLSVLVTLTSLALRPL